MTYNELKKQTAALGFESGIEDDEGFYSAADRALAMLFLDRPQISRARTYIESQRLTKIYKTIKHKGGDAESFILEGTCYSFLPHGDGFYVLFDGVTATRVEFYATGEYQKGIIVHDKAMIRFEGESDYTITSLASFSIQGVQKGGTLPEYVERREIFLKDRLPLFRALASYPEYEGKPIREVVSDPSRLCFDSSFDGEIEFDYFRLPRRIERKEIPIDLPPETEQLFPLLVASFLWLDDDAEKAQYYMALYRDGIAGIKQKERIFRTANYVTNGWA